MNKISEQFSNIPERCLSCPALRDASERVDDILGWASHSMDKSLQESDPRLYEIQVFIEAVATNYAADILETAPALAQELVEACTNGPIELEISKSSLFKKRVGRVACGSRHPMTSFFPIDGYQES